MLRSFLPSVALLFVFLFPTAFTVFPQQSDPNFGANGLVLTDFPPISGDPFERATEHAVKSFSLSDGNILTLAQVDNRTAKGPPSITVRLLMYLNNGSLFGSLGGEGNFVISDAVRQPDGKIIAAGYTYGIYNSSQLGALNWKIVRFNANGSHDTSFNATGVVTRGFAQNEDIINGVAVQPDGKIVVSGTSANNTNGTVTIIGRFNADGSVDASFGSYGEGFFDIYDGGRLSRKPLVTPSGKILLSGSMPDGASGRNLLVAQYNPNGSPDASFGNQGAKIIDLGGSEFLYDAAQQPDGKIVLLAVSEYSVPGSTNYREQEINVVRLNADGSIDSGFGMAGRTVINTSPAYNSSPGNYQPTGFETPANILVQSDGSILFSAVSRQLLLSRRNVVTIFRLNSAGQITARNFSRKTKAIQGVSDPRSMQMRGILSEPSGKILTSGSVTFQITADSQIALARFSALSAVNDTNPFFDYNFDGKAEFAVYRPPGGSGLGLWLFLNSHNGGAPDYLFDSREYGLSGDIIAPGDYDGDYIQDLAVFRPSTGEWITRKIYLNNCAPTACAETIQFGANGDIPAPGDFDGDGKTDRAVFRPSGGDWFILFSSTGGYTGFHFGQNGDQPVTGDYDGDGKSDAAVIRRENGKIFWFISQSSDGAFVAFQFGNSEDKTAVADYNGDGKTEVAVWRPSNGTFYALANYTDFSYLQLGSNGDVPMPADFDGDKKDEFAVYTPATGAHTFFRSSDGLIGGTQFGLPSDIPLASAYVR